MNMKVCIVLLGLCVAMAAGRSLDREVLRKLILERLNVLNEEKVARKMLLGKSSGAVDQFQAAMNALRSAIFSYEDAYGTEEASSLARNFARIVGGIVSAATAGESSNTESTDEFESTTSTEKPATTTEGEDSTTTSSPTSTTSTATSTASTTRTASPTSTTTAPSDTKRILQQLLRELNIRRK